MTIKLPNNQFQGVALRASYGVAGLLINIPSNAVPWAHFWAKHLGTVGKWYGSYGGGTPTTSVHDFVVEPGMPHQVDCPTKGNINILVDGTADGDLDWSASWAT